MTAEEILSDLRVFAEVYFTGPMDRPKLVSAVKQAIRRLIDECGFDATEAIVLASGAVAAVESRSKVFNALN